MSFKSNDRLQLKCWTAEKILDIDCTRWKNERYEFLIHVFKSPAFSLREFFLTNAEKQDFVHPRRKSLTLVGVQIRSPFVQVGQLSLIKLHFSIQTHVILVPSATRSLTKWPKETEALGTSSWNVWACALLSLVKLRNDDKATTTYRTLSLLSNWLKKTATFGT